MSDRSPWTVQYMQRVLATDPIAYWQQNERQGAIAYEMVTTRSNGARNGVYTGTTPGQPGIGDGNPVQFFDGANDFNDIYSASLNTAFDGQSVTVMVWFRVVNAGVWTDGTFRRAVTFRVNANNRLLIQKTNLNNTINLAYRANNVLEQVTINIFAGRTDWISAFLTADLAADEMRAYIDGVQVGATQVGLGTWAGNLDPVLVLVGAQSQAPAAVWDGFLAHPAVWDRALPPAEIADLSVVQ